MSHRIDYNAVAPAAMKALGGVYGYVMASGLPADLVDLVYLRVSQINGCAYCIDMHTRDLIKKEVAVAKLALVPVWREARPLFNEKEQAALAWAESVTRIAEVGAPDDEYDDVIAALGEKGAVDLTVAIGLMNAFNRLGRGFEATPAAVAAIAKAA
jgi:AhpD family alkylhydroperoxidase